MNIGIAKITLHKKVLSIFADIKLLLLIKLIEASHTDIRGYKYTLLSAAVIFLPDLIKMSSRVVYFTVSKIKQISVKF